jgi:adenylate cyclase
VERPTTIFFSDVRGFTSMSEELNAGEVVARLNEYLGLMVAEVIQTRGLVDKFIGDAVMAVWGSLSTHPTEETTTQDALNAVEACLAMRRALATLNERWQARGLSPWQIGMGIHQGPVVVGNIGSAAPHEKMDLTVIGDAVNLASRLESLTKQYGVDLIISEDIHRRVENHYLCCPLDLVAPKGKTLPVAIYAVLGRTGEPIPPGVEEFRQVMQHYRAGDFPSARTALEAAARTGFMPDLVKMYQDRLQALGESAPEGWTGVWTMKQK